MFPSNEDHLALVFLETVSNIPLYVYYGVSVALTTPLQFTLAILIATDILFVNLKSIANFDICEFVWVFLRR